jgi:hypothetical protein
MMHILVHHNEVKKAYLTHHDLPSGQIGLENCNPAPAMSHNVWQLIADKWNDVLFTPSTNAMDCHSGFLSRRYWPLHCVQLCCSYSRKGGGQVGGMVLALNKIIKNWKRSKQGDGGFQDDADDDDTYYGTLADCTQEALDNHASFIKDGEESYLLYFWELIDGHCLLASAMQKLNDQVSAANGAAGVPTIVFRGRRDDKSIDDESTNKSDSGKFKKLAASINKYGSKMVASAQIKANSKLIAVGAQIINTLWCQKRKLVCQIAVETIKKNNVMVDVLTKQMTEIDEEIRTAKSNMPPATPVRNNCSPQDADGTSG